MAIHRMMLPGILNQLMQMGDGVKDDGYVVVGYAYVSLTGFDIYVIRLNSNGSVAWQKTFDGLASQSDAAYAVEETSTDSILICGSVKTTAFGLTQNDNFWVTRLDLAGNVGTGWPREYGSTKEMLHLILKKTMTEIT